MSAVLKTYHFTFQPEDPLKQDGVAFRSISIHPSYAAIGHSMCALLDKFEIHYNKAVVLYKTMLFAAWMKAVDTKYDHEGESPAYYIELFKNPDLLAEVSSGRTDPAISLITELHQLGIHHNKLFVNILDVLLETAVEQNGVTSMPELLRLNSRTSVLSAEAFMELIAEDVDLSPRFRKAYLDACVAAGLLDTVIDLREDVANGIVKFTPTSKDRFLLYKTFCIFSLRTLSDSPELLGLLPLMANVISAGIWHKLF